MTSSLMARLVEVVDGLGSVHDVPALLQRISSSAHDLLDAYAVGVVVRHGDEFEIIASTGRTISTGWRFPYAGSAVEALAQRGDRSLRAEPGRFTHLSGQLYRDGPMPLAVALTRADAYGALYVVRATALTDDEVEVLEVLAASAGAALRSAETYAAAVVERREKEAVIDAMADGLAVLDAQGCVRAWNRALTEITGISAEEAIGSPLPFPVPDDDLPLDHELPNGHWIEVVVAAVHGTPDRVVDVRDISRAKELETAKDLFLATASHELRTPLTVLRGFGETLLNHWDALDDPKRREIVTTILTRTRAMTALVEQLLLGSRAGLGLDVQVRRFDLAGTVRSSVAALAGSRPDRELVVEAPEPVPAYGDDVTTDAVLGQLVENALKYSPDGGPITITARTDGDEAVLEVADTGIGIPPGDRERVFERFVRSEQTRGTSASGSGLGLWIVRRYVEAQGGRVRALPRPGGGTVLEVRLPAAP